MGSQNHNYRFQHSLPLEPMLEILSCIKSQTANLLFQFYSTISYGTAAITIFGSIIKVAPGTINPAGNATNPSNSTGTLHPVNIIKAPSVTTTQTRPDGSQPDSSGKCPTSNPNTSSPPPSSNNNNPPANNPPPSGGSSNDGGSGSSNNNNGGKVAANHGQKINLLKNTNRQTSEECLLLYSWCTFNYFLNFFFLEVLSHIRAAFFASLFFSKL